MHTKLATSMIDQNFASFVKNELGDIATADSGGLVGKKIRNYWKAWCYSMATTDPAYHADRCKMALDDTYDFNGTLVTIDRTRAYARIFEHNNS